MDKPAVVSLADILAEAVPLQLVSEPDEPVTFEQLAALEPRLAELRARARRVRDPGGRRGFCANEVWFRELKPELLHLVGWQRREEPWILCTSQAYEAAYKVIYDELPNCRRCGCL